MDQNRIIAGAVIGGIIGLAVGYGIYAAQSPYGLSLTDWLTSSHFEKDAFLYGIGGICAGSAAIFLFSKSKQ
jgi:hypothetical protein